MLHSRPYVVRRLPARVMCTWYWRPYSRQVYQPGLGLPPPHSSITHGDYIYETLQTLNPKHRRFGSGVCVLLFLCPYSCFPLPPPRCSLSLPDLYSPLKVRKPHPVVGQDAIPRKITPAVAAAAAATPDVGDALRASTTTGAW